MSFADQLIELGQLQKVQKARIESLEAENEDLAKRLDAASREAKRLTTKAKRLERKAEGMTLADEEFLWGHRHVEILLSRTLDGQRKLRMRFGGPARPQIRAQSPTNPVLTHAFRKLREDFGDEYGK